MGGACGMRVLPRYSYSREVANYIFTPVINEGCKWSLRISLTSSRLAPVQPMFPRPIVGSIGQRRLAWVHVAEEEPDFATVVAHWRRASVSRLRVPVV